MEQYHVSQFHFRTWRSLSWRGHSGSTKRSRSRSRGVLEWEGIYTLLLGPRDTPHGFFMSYPGPLHEWLRHVLQCSQSSFLTHNVLCTSFFMHVLLTPRIILADCSTGCYMMGDKCKGFIDEPKNCKLGELESCYHNLEPNGRRSMYVNSGAYQAISG